MERTRLSAEKLEGGKSRKQDERKGERDKIKNTEGRGGGDKYGKKRKYVGLLHS